MLKKYAKVQHILPDASSIYMVTIILQDQQYMFGVKSLLMVDCCREPGRCVVSTTDRSGRFPHAVKPACGGLNIYMNLDDTLKNKTLMFDV